MSNNYEQTVRRMAETNADELISNSEPEHAATLYKVFFENARQSVMLLCKDFDERVFSRKDVLSAFKDAVRRGVKFDVIVQQQSDNEFKGTFNNESTKRPKQLQLIEAYQHTSEGANKVATAPNNFCVVDGKGFRWEENRAECIATASMNRPALASQLTRLFKSCREMVLA